MESCLYRECRAKNGGEPSSNTLRGRYDACKAYFEFLELIGALEGNPCDWLARPSSKANLKPFLDPEEDARLAALDKNGHELAVYALARRAALREGEICDLQDRDVDLTNAELLVRDGKTDAAARIVPLMPHAVAELAGYREWRDNNVSAESAQFVRTRSGTISAGYVWKLVKAMGRRAGIRLAVDESGNPLLDPNGNQITELTPHSLRRTFGSHLIRNDVPTGVFSPIIGHSSKRVTDESYALLTNAEAARKVLAVVGVPR